MFEEILHKYLDKHYILKDNKILYNGIRTEYQGNEYNGTKLISELIKIFSFGFKLTIEYFSSWLKNKGTSKDLITLHTQVGDLIVFPSEFGLGPFLSHNKIDFNCNEESYSFVLFQNRAIRTRFNYEPISINFIEPTQEFVNKFHDLMVTQNSIFDIVVESVGNDRILTYKLIGFIKEIKTNFDGEIFGFEVVIGVNNVRTITMDE